MRVSTALPERFNDGTRIPKPIYAFIEQEILAIAGGFSVTFGTGVWLNGAEIFRDQSRFYSINIEPHQLPELKRVLYRAKRELKQSAIMLSISEGRTTELIT